MPGYLSYVKPWNVIGEPNIHALHVNKIDPMFASKPVLGKGTDISMMLSPLNSGNCFRFIIDVFILNGRYNTNNPSCKCLPYQRARISTLQTLSLLAFVYPIDSGLDKSEETS